MMVNAFSHFMRVDNYYSVFVILITRWLDALTSWVLPSGWLLIALPRRRYLYGLHMTNHGANNSAVAINLHKAHFRWIVRV